MKGTVPQKVGRLAADLVTHPRYLSRYVAHNVLSQKYPLDLEIPWLSYAVIDFLKEYLQPNMTVCEYGSGGSTLFFAKRVKSVVSIEDNPKWYERVSQRLAEHGLTNVTLKLAPFDFKNPLDFEKSAYMNSMPDTTFDVIVIDGSEEWVQVRPIYFRHAEKHIKPGGIIVVDDSWRYQSLRVSHGAKRYEIFQSVGPGRPGVTSTDVYFY